MTTMHSPSSPTAPSTLSRNEKITRVMFFFSIAALAIFGITTMVIYLSTGERRHPIIWSLFFASFIWTIVSSSVYGAERQKRLKRR